MATLNTRIVLRNDTAANWLASNPVLIAGELGFENDTGRFKIGNGTSTWAALDYATNGANENAGIVATHYEGTTNLADETDADVIARVLGDVIPNIDDVFIVKRLIADDKYTHTAYVYNKDGNWAAMDGNYNADNVYFGDNLLATANFGTVVIPAAGHTTIAAKGKNLSSLLHDIMVERIYPKTVEPYVEIKFLNEPLNVEAGTKIIPVYEAKLNEGAYSYNATSVKALSWNITDNLGNTSALDAGTLPEITIGDIEYKLTATVSHSEGDMPLDNIGDAYELGRIGAGTKEAETETSIFSFRNIFYGTFATSSEEEPLTTTMIRSLTAAGAYSSPKNLVVNAGVQNAKRVVVAYPENERLGLVGAILTSTMNLDITSEYAAQPDMMVEGANGYLPVNYKVFVYEPALLGSDEVHEIILA